MPDPLCQPWHDQRSAEAITEDAPPDRINHANNEGAKERAPNRPDAADHDDHQHGDQDIIAHAGLNRQNRTSHEAGQTGERSPQTENQRVEQTDIDAQHGHHARVAGACADQHSHPRMMDNDIERGCYGEADGDDQKPIRRIRHSEDHHGPSEPVRRTHIERLRSPDDPDELIEHQNQAKRRQHLVEVIAIIKRAQRGSLDDGANEEGAKHSCQAGDDERPRAHEHCRPDIRPQHVERRVREVDEIHDAQHQREAGTEQEQEDPVLQAVERLCEKKIPSHLDRGCFRSFGLASFAGRSHFIGHCEW